MIEIITNSEQIVGGYNPLQWDSIIGTKDSFIFSFTDRNNFQTAKVSYPDNGVHQSVNCYLGYGPIFGGGYDLWSHNNGNWGSYPQTYPKIDIPKRFNINDYEVFQINIK